ncbi:MAG: cAMP receptor protein [Pseudomonadota bacterium]|jgi:CRP-like cAMP-binding protein
MSTNPTTGTLPRQRPLIENPVMAQRAAELLRTPQAVRQLEPAECAVVVSQMQLVYYPDGSTLFREGDESHSSYMLLVLDGWVSVDTGLPNGPDSIAVAVLGPGSIIGEMALLDGAPRSASCTANSPVQAAGLSRVGLERLLDENPRVAARLMVALATRISDRLRAMSKQLQMYGQITGSMQGELDRLRADSR